jgi:hypothetical protein
MNWLENADHQLVFAGQKLVVAGGSSGMGRQVAAVKVLTRLGFTIRPREAATPG